MKFVILGLLVVVFIGFCVALWKAAQDWRWYNIVASVFIMLLTVTFLFPTAHVLKSRQSWHKVKEDLERRADQVKAEQRQLKFGDPNIPGSEQGVVVLSHELAKLGLETGRRWRGLRKHNVSVNNDVGVVDLTLQRTQDPNVVPEQPVDSADGTEQPLPMIPEELVVYGFLEQENEQGIKVPIVYVGEYQVKSSSPNEVTLKPTLPLMPFHQQIAGNQSGEQTWSVYELLPLDGHETFIASGSVPSDENFLGRVDEELVRKLLEPNSNDLPRASADTLQTYLDDGRRAIQDDPPISRWVRIEFDREYSIDVDSPEQRGALELGYFDGNGRAVDGRLKQGGDGTVKFGAGEQVVVKEEVASQLIGDGTAHLIDTYYLRPLNDYRYIIRRVRLRLNEVANRLNDLAVERSTLQAAIDKTNSMLVDNQDIKLKLEQDSAQFRVEKLAIKSYSDQLRQQIDQLRDEMTELYKDNVSLEQQLRVITQSIQDGSFGSSSTQLSAERAKLDSSRDTATASLH